MIEFIVYFVGVSTIIVVFIEAARALFFREKDYHIEKMPEYFTKELYDIGVWQAKGIKIIGVPNVVEPPIHFKGEALSVIYEQDDTVCLELIYPNHSIDIFVDKEELEGESKEQIITYLIKRKILEI